jgi:hypothetical protein
VRLDVGEAEEQLDTKMNKYKITKIVYANSVGEADEIISGGETSSVELVDDEKNKKIGFHEQHND